MIDFKEFFTSLKIKLVGILYSDKYNPKWKEIVLSQLGNENIEIAIENNKVKPGCHFTQDLLAHYETFLQKVELAKDVIRNRCVWFSSHITDIGRPLINQHLLDFGLIYVTDFLGKDLNGEYYVMNYTEFRAIKMGGMNIITNTQYLKIKMGIKRAYPSIKLTKIDEKSKVSMLLNNKGEAKGSGDLRLNMYDRIDFSSITPCMKWEAYFKTGISWIHTFETLYQSTGTNKLREFQYKLVHRVATCRYMRKKMKIETTDMCHLCGTTSETLEHQQLHCAGTKKFRGKLEGILRCKLPAAATEQSEVGFFTCISSMSIVSFLRLVANYYINKRFHKKKLLWWEEYSAWVKREIRTEAKLSHEEKQLILDILEK